MAHNETPEIIGDQYKVIKKIGQGGMGAVYKAHDKYLDRLVAVKMLHFAGDLAGPDVARFQREAQAAGKLNHFNIISTLNFGITAQGNPYLVMEYLEGESFSRLLKREAPMPFPRAEYFVEQIASALHYSHNHGVIHRDLKPSNVMVVEDSKGDLVTKLVDFGLAQIKDNDQNITRTGFGMGSPLYMAPEQVKGRKADERSDIYALGCMIFQMITGRLPIEDEVVFDTMSRKCDESAPLMSEVMPDKSVPPRLDALVAKCLEINPDNRFSDMAEFQTSAKKAFGRQTSVNLSIPDLPKASKKRNTIATTVGAILLLATSGLVIFGIMNEGPRQAEERQEELRESKIADETGEFIVHEIPKAVIKFQFKNESSVHTVRPSPVVDEDLKELADHPYLRSVRLDTAPMTGTGLKYLYPLEIEELKLSGTNLNEEGMKTLSGLKHLKDLNLAHCAGITNDGLKSIVNLNQLWRLVLKETPIDDHCLKTVSTMRSLTHLDISVTPKITTKGLAYLSKMPKLKSLHIGGDATTVSIFDALSKFPQLTEVIIDQLDNHDVLADGLRSLSRVKTLERVELTKMRVPNDLGVLLLPLKKRFGLILVDVTLTKEALESLAQTDKLEELTITESVVSCSDLRGLCKLKQLGALRISAMESVESQDEFEQTIKLIKASIPKCRLFVSE